LLISCLYVREEEPFVDCDVIYIYGRHNKCPLTFTSTFLRIGKSLSFLKLSTQSRRREMHLAREHCKPWDGYKCASFSNRTALIKNMEEIYVALPYSPAWTVVAKGVCNRILFLM
jgi:hypothetical protein